nr:minor capsid protein [Enterococcus casseliflavus]
MASGQGQQDLARNRQIPFMVQIIIKNTNQSQAFNDAWKIADSFDKLPRKENGEWVTLRSSDGSFLFDSSEVYTQPRNLGIQEHDAYLYVLTVRLNISK